MRLGPNDITLSDSSVLTVNFGKPLNDEDAHQAAIFQWKQKEQRLAYPDLRWLYATPNGGARDKITASTLKKTGVAAGILDMSLLKPVGDFAGLHIEQKYGKNKLSKEQIEYGNWLIDNFAYVACCYDWKESIGIIVKYLTNKLDKPVRFE